MYGVKHREPPADQDAKNKKLQKIYDLIWHLYTNLSPQDLESIAEVGAKWLWETELVHEYQQNKTKSKQKNVVL